METRRSFLRKAGMLSGAAGLAQMMPETLVKALMIDPEPGSTFYDAEHIVFLMQENRSFDHAFGTLQGVRGFADPRAIMKPDGYSVWLQKAKDQQCYTPFRLDIKNTRITWMGSLPHAWTDQVDARNKGHMDQWLIAKEPGQKEYKHLPLSMGYYTREDIPFYYALADAFTICDQHFCSSLTGTTPNRLHFWSGTIRDKNKDAKVWNGDADYGGGEVNWKTYPERLEENGISWKIYQNEIYSYTGLGDKQDWLDNFGDNPLEYFKQYHVRMMENYISAIPQHIEEIESEIKKLGQELLAASNMNDRAKINSRIRSLTNRIQDLKKERQVFTRNNYQKLSAFEKSIHEKAFCINNKDPFYRQTAHVKYDDGNRGYDLELPKGDILHQFREDVQNGKLPTVSWLVSPAAFSDHPSYPWYGAWYVSEVIDILTNKPEMWKKTIFILTYDENDGYFDHVNPFAPHDPQQKNTGRSSPGIDTSNEYVRTAQQSGKGNDIRESNIGLGFRVPMIVASPWTRGGYVNSQVFDHTSCLMFLEKFLQRRTGKTIREENISAWRRTVCGDLSSVFRKFTGEKITIPERVQREPYAASIYAAKNKGLPQAIAADIDTIRSMNEILQPLAELQEQGIRGACALPYELYADVSIVEKKLLLHLAAGNHYFGKAAAGAPFSVYTFQEAGTVAQGIRNYTVAAGTVLEDEIFFSAGAGKYRFDLHGPNGFYRKLSGTAGSSSIKFDLTYEEDKSRQLTGAVILTIRNSGGELFVKIINHYQPSQIGTFRLKEEPSSHTIQTKLYHGWYDISIRIEELDLEYRAAGRVETGVATKTDPLMGGVAGLR